MSNQNWPKAMCISNVFDKDTNIKDGLNQIWYGTLECCNSCRLSNNKEFAVVHACKTPCFEERHGQPNLPIKDRLWVETENELYLNLIDPIKSLFFLESFYKYFDFVNRHWGRKKILVHCNQGQSRSPSLCWLWLANQELIDNSSPEKSLGDIQALHGQFWPGTGIKTFIFRNWAALMNYRSTKSV